MNRLTILLLAALLLSCGCKQYGSLHPLANPDQPVYDDQLIGRWYGMKASQDPQTGDKIEVPDTDNHFTFSKYGITGYKLTAVNTKKNTQLDLEIYPFHVGDRTFLQMQRPKFKANEENAGILRVYYFAPYNLEDDKLSIQFTKTDEIKQLATADGLPVAETDQMVLLTGGRQQTLDFLEKHMDELYPPDKHPRPLYRAESLDLDMAEEE